MTKTMLLIDADNVSVDVIEQAVARLLAEHGALHVRRAYCTAEAALKHQAVFKRLSIRPMVNLSTGKNSTDILLAIDAIDLVSAEQPDLVAIASSDSDFAPLVARLREKGCRVVGLGQGGKTGDATQAVYDEFVVLEHGSGRRRSTARRPADVVPAPLSAPVPSARRAAVDIVLDDEPPVPTRAPRAARKAAPRSAPAKSIRPGKSADAADAAHAAKPATGRGAAGRRAAAPALPKELQAVLQHLPELGEGATLELRVVSARLREAGLLTGRASCTKLLAPFGEWLELLPPRAPNHVRWRAAAD